MAVINYVAHLHSQLHLNSFRAYWIGQKEKSNTMEGTVVIHTSAAEDSLLKEDDFKFLDNNNRIVFFHEENKKRGGKLKKLWNNYLYLLKIKHYYTKTNFNTTFFILLPSVLKIRPSQFYNLAMQNPGKKPCMVILEEGIGNYIRNEKRWRERGLETEKGIKKIIKWGLNIIRESMTQNSLLKVLKRHNAVDYFYFFTREKGLLRVNKDVCRLFALSFKLQKVPVKDMESYDNCILINSQPFFEEINCNEDIECYKKLINICRILKIEVRLKPHPREKQTGRYASLGIKIDTVNKRISQECVLAHCKEKPLAIAGFFSTTLVTSNILWGIPAISLGNLIDGSKLSGFERDTQNFICQFREIINVPANYSELEDMLTEARQGNLTKKRI